MFQFTLPRGERPDAPRKSDKGAKVSIHAPAWGATITFFIINQICNSFNSRSRVGSDTLSYSGLILTIVFQFTLPRGERLVEHGLLSEVGEFQFTLPRGERRDIDPEQREERAVSIHAPAWGATQRPPEACAPFPVSIHAPAWGATKRQRRQPSEPLVSIHAPAWGATRRPREPRRPLERFNSRSRVGSDSASSPSTCKPRSFNSRSRMGSDPSKLTYQTGQQTFQFTLPHGERPPPVLTPPRPVPVSIHAPAWGATPTIPAITTRGRGFNSRSRMGSDWPNAHVTTNIALFQFTLPHGERLKGLRWLLGVIPVSIHAPAWGATEAVPVRPSRLPVSIHAPAWGATPTFAASASALRFQFTLPHGGRPRHAVGKVPTSQVSIHAPAWGATTFLFPPAFVRGVSIHAPAWGATSYLLAVDPHDEFQFTLPHGERLQGIIVRLRELAVSIHAPAWGATEEPPLSPPPPEVSIHAPAWGATDREGGRAGVDVVSIHAPAWGATRRASMPPPRGISFNSRSRMGSDFVFAGMVGDVLGFNSRSRMGSDIARRARPPKEPRFNSRSRMGSDHIGLIPLKEPKCFNSRSRMGSDRTD